jgi:hypothetical protein
VIVMTDAAIALDANVSPDVSMSDAGPSADDGGGDGDGGDASACTRGAIRCVVSEPQYCTNLGKWQATSGTCTPACVAASGRFHINRLKTVTVDTQARLEWQRIRLSPGAVSFQAAEIFCASGVVPGLSGARLPTAAELRSLVVGGGCYPAIDQTAFPDMQASPAWTSEVDAQGNIETVNFATGAVEWHAPSEELAMICVRKMRGGH